MTTSHEPQTTERPVCYRCKQGNRPTIVWLFTRDLHLPPQGAFYLCRDCSDLLKDWLRNAQ